MKTFAELSIDGTISENIFTPNQILDVDFLKSVKKKVGYIPTHFSKYNNITVAMKCTNFFAAKGLSFLQVLDELDYNFSEKDYDYANAVGNRDCAEIIFNALMRRRDALLSELKPEIDQAETRKKRKI